MVTAVRPARVVCCSVDPSRVYGFVIADAKHTPPLLHWIWVRHTFRGQGLGTRMLAQVLADAGEKLSPTAWTRDMQMLIEKRPEMFQAPRHDLARR